MSYMNALNTLRSLKMRKGRLEQKYPDSAITLAFSYGEKEQKYTEAVPAIGLIHEQLEIFDEEIATAKVQWFLYQDKKLLDKGFMTIAEEESDQRQNANPEAGAIQSMVVLMGEFQKNLTKSVSETMAEVKKAMDYRHEFQEQMHESRMKQMEEFNNKLHEARTEQMEARMQLQLEKFKMEKELDQEPSGFEKAGEFATKLMDKLEESPTLQAIAKSLLEKVANPGRPVAGQAERV
ncbi:hypothetical protein AB3N61_09265 [Leptospira sp. WS58.C1]|uniref:hypothetical protein n=1 Tax=Leptospira cinconiae TaxID=3235173 RepID=UPI00349EA18D